MNNTTLTAYNDSYGDTLLSDQVAPYIFAVIFVIGFVGNGLLIFIIVANSTMRSVTNLLLLSLAIGDFLVIICCVPLRGLLYVSDNWMYGSFLCHIYEFTISLSQGVSIFTLTALAGDRFVAIVWPISTLSWMTKRKTVTATIIIWALAILFALPDLITSRLSNTQTFYYCDMYGLIPDGTTLKSSYQLTRRLMNLIVYYIIPVLLITSMYMVIAFALFRVRSTTLRNSFKLSDSTVIKKQQNTRKKIAKIVLALIILFIVCWTPRHIFIFVVNYAKIDVYDFESRITWQLISFVFCYSNSCVNPPTLYFMSSDFKRFFNHYLFGLCCKKKRLSRHRRSSEIGMNTLSTHTKPMAHTLNGV